MFELRLRSGYLIRVNEISAFDQKIKCKLGCVVRMVVDSILPHAESGPNDNWKDAPPFSLSFKN